MPLRLPAQLADHSVVCGADELVTDFDNSKISRAQLQRLRDEHRQISNLLRCVQELTRSAIDLDSIPDLFSRAFPTLFQCFEFDIGIAILLEQHLALSIVTREAAEKQVTEALVERVRRSVQPLLPPTFAATEVVVMREEHTLSRSGERRAGSGEDLRHELHSLLELENRTAGVLLLYSSRPFPDDAAELLGIYATQVSLLLASIRTREKISNLADTDELTGIGNRRYFRRQLPREIERARVYNVPLALHILDVDDFKRINDNFGHTVGDVVLSELAGAIRETLRPPDTFTRFGGDEFSIILPHTDLNGARAVAERILAKVRGLSIDADEERIRCTISIGIAEFQPADDLSANHLVRRADEHLYEAKRAGKNRYNA